MALLKEFKLQCDNCGEYSDAYEGWHDCVGAAKRNGWMMIKKDADEWAHYCHDCKEKADE